MVQLNNGLEMDFLVVRTNMFLPSSHLQKSFKFTLSLILWNPQIQLLPYQPIGLHQNWNWTPQTKT